jgi:hypothetical protein
MTTIVSAEPSRTLTLTPNGQVQFRVPFDRLMIAGSRQTSA